MQTAPAEPRDSDGPGSARLRRGKRAGNSGRGGRRMLKNSPGRLSGGRRSPRAPKTPGLALGHRGKAPSLSAFRINDIHLNNHSLKTWAQAPGGPHEGEEAHGAPSAKTAATPGRQHPLPTAATPPLQQEPGRALRRCRHRHISCVAPWTSSRGTSRADGDGDGTILTLGRAGRVCACACVCVFVCN